MVVAHVFSVAQGPQEVGQGRIPGARTTWTRLRPIVCSDWAAKLALHWFWLRAG
jgi:hypothetical protein